MKVLPILLLSLAFPVQAAVYKWVDEDGNVSYADIPPPGGEAKLMDLPESSRYAPRALPSSAGSLPAEASEPVLGTYEAVAIAKPKPEETLHNRDLTVDIEVRLDPALQEGHSLTFVLDGEEIGKGLTGTRMRLENVERGPHVLSVGVYDNAGNEVARSASVRFYLLTETVIKEPLVSAAGKEERGAPRRDGLWDKWAQDLERYKTRHETDLQRIKENQQPIATAPPVPPVPSDKADLETDVPEQYRDDFEEYQELSDAYREAHRSFGSIQPADPQRPYAPNFSPSYSPIPPTPTPFGAR